MSNTIEEKNATVSDEKLSMNYVLEQIEKIAAQTEYLGQTIGAIGQLESADDSNDVALRAKAEALGDVVRCRETTNQQLIRLYEKMYDDLKKQFKEEYI